MPAAKKDKTARRVAALELKLAELEAAQPKPAPPESRMLSKEEQDAWQNSMHELREKNASIVQPWLREACSGGVTRADMQDTLKASHRPAGPSAQGPQRFPELRGNVPSAGGGSGWVDARPLGPPPGLQWVDRQLDAQDARDKAERLQQAAQLKAMRQLQEQTEQLRQVAEQTKKVTEP
jgi:hypothetical protein